MARADEELIRAEVERRKITRLCHLTPVRNLLQIATGRGLQSVSELEQDRAAFDQQDLERYDNHPDHISCSIEYPNVWYLQQRLRQATSLQKLFPNWVCLLIDPSHLWAPSTEFSPRNASAQGGALLKPGYKAFMELYADEVSGARGKSWGRGLKPESCPTDDQAEVMIHKRVPLQDAGTIVFADEARAADNLGALRLLGVPAEAFDYVIAPAFFETNLSSVLRSGGKPLETPWTPE
ncbi:MAG TPA: DarT ssDNA thymidine ADP-ribosyltransferase family protein [Solirubrobacterales bacterium]